MSRSTLGLASVLLLSSALVGCNGDDPGTASPTAPTTSAGTQTTTTSPEPTEPTDPAGGQCALVTDEDLTTATGTEQRVLEPVSQGAFTECRTAFDERGMTVQWDLVEASSSFAEVGEEAQLPGLDRREVQVGDQRAWLLEGRIVDTDSVQVVLLLDGVKLSVDANDAGDSTASVTEAQLRAAAEAVAAAYVR